MNEEFIPYEQALALKELGFDEECLSYYFNKQLSFGTRTSYGEVIEAPLYQQAFGWFREKYRCHSEINVGFKGFHFKIYSFIDSSESGDVFVVDNLTNYKPICFNSCEEAELECLKKLIEIIK